jgi:hypothetical protein
MNCENCKYPTLCKVTIIGSVITVISAGSYWLYYKLKTPSESPKEPESDNTPDVNLN